MTFAQISNTWASGLVPASSLTFMIVYHRYAPWRSTAVGRHLMAVAAAIGALGLYTILITVWPQGLPAAVLRVARTVILLAIAGLMLQRARMVIRAQKHHR
ncbi:hypothetical protein ABZ707_02985 [Streptomyces sp. NPDC006923]|uniref:putative phage holin n=1 Tax=Streptomyces sp. NPDC006923 TaxID=3155355 RepID=UPI0033E3FCC4